MRALGLVAGSLLVALAVAACGPAPPPPRVPARSWQTVEPEEAGFARDRLLMAQLYARGLDSRAVVVVRGGAIVASWGDPGQRYDVGELRRGLLNALVGHQVGRGALALTDTLEQLGLDDSPPLTAVEKSATVADLLTGRSGVYHDAVFEERAGQVFRPRRGAHAPGTWFFDSSWNVDALGAIVAQRAGAPIGADFEERVARPIGMEDYGPGDAIPTRGPASDLPSVAFWMSARDLARFGLLYARGGAWGADQVVPADWVRQSTTMHVPAVSGVSQSAGEGTMGYGYLWWGRSRGGQLIPCASLPVGTFAATSGGGSYLVVVPAYDLVVVHLMDVRQEKARRVSPVQFGALLQRILDAAGTTATTPTPTGAPCHGRG